jgi:hypothetical protein
MESNAGLQETPISKASVLFNSSLTKELRAEIEMTKSHEANLMTINFLKYSAGSKKPIID